MQACNFRSQRCCAWLGLGLLSLAVAVVGEELVTVRTGQELADAVAAWGASGSSMTIQIDVPFISVLNATFQTQQTITARTGTQQPFSSGRLIIRGQGPAGSPPTTVLDAANRMLLIPGVSGSAQFAIEDLILLNMCEWTSVGLGVQFTTPFAFSLFTNSPAYVSRTLSNVHAYVRHWALKVLTYQMLMQSSIMPEFRDAAALVLSSSGPQSEPSDEFSSYVLGSKVYVTADTSMRNFVVQSLDTPNDPVLSKLRAGGKLMQPSFCYGVPINESAVNSASQRIGPLWVAVDQATFLSSLDAATAYTSVPPLIKGMPVMLAVGHNPVTVPNTTTYNVFNRLMLTSNKPGNLPSWDLLLPINFNQRVGVLNIAPGADVMFQWLALTGLASQVPTRLPASLAGRSPDSLLPSVFPLAAFNTSTEPKAWNTTAQVILANVTLAIPPDDYLALFILTSKQGKAGIPACADPTLSQRVDQLAAGISSWTGSSAADATLEQQLQKPKQDMLFASFVGWGMNSTLLRLVPTSPLVLPSCQQSNQQSSSTRARTIGLAVGLSCGLTLLVAVLAALVLCARKHSRHSTSEKSSSPYNSTTQLESSVCIIQDEDTGTDSKTISAASEVPPTTRAFPKSSLHKFVHEAMTSQHHVFAAIAGKAFTPSNSTGDTPSSPAVEMAHQDQLHDQIKDLAAKLQQDGNKLVLAGVLGSGSGGTVYMGLWRGLRVAVKTVVFHESADALGEQGGTAFQQRVIMETAIAASVGHRNLVATYHYDIKALVATEAARSVGGLEINLEGGKQQQEHHVYKLFLVQELCNTSLADGLRKALFMDGVTGQLDLVAVLYILVDVATGLEYLHEKGIIHGDLKPDNILLKLDPSAGEGVVAKLTDFGQSTKLSPGDTHVSNYKSGTPFYIAPEVSFRHRLSPASDLFSFGVIMWELFMQRPPYVVSRDDRQHLAGWHPMFPDYPLDNTPPAAYYDLSNRCLEHEPHVRPTAKDAVQELKRLLKACKAK